MIGTNHWQNFVDADVNHQQRDKQSVVRLREDALGFRRFMHVFVLGGRDAFDPIKEIFRCRVADDPLRHVAVLEGENGRNFVNREFVAKFWAD
jgi:hypothetical protein